MPALFPVKVLEQKKWLFDNSVFRFIGKTKGGSNINRMLCEANAPNLVFFWQLNLVHIKIHYNFQKKNLTITILFWANEAQKGMDENKNPPKSATHII